MEGDVDAARHRDLLADQPLRGGGVVVQDVADVARLPAGVADGVAGVLDLEPGELLVVGVDDRGEGAQQPARARPGATSRQAGKASWARLDRGVGVGLGRPTAPREAAPVAGLTRSSS